MLQTLSEILPPLVILSVLPEPPLACPLTTTPASCLLLQLNGLILVPAMLSSSLDGREEGEDEGTGSSPSQRRGKLQCPSPTDACYFAFVRNHHQPGDANLQSTVTIRSDSYFLGFWAGLRLQKVINITLYTLNWMPREKPPAISNRTLCWLDTKLSKSSEPVLPGLYTYPLPILKGL